MTGDALLDAVYGCVECGESYGFERAPGAAGFFKFPPTIGATDQADLLFIGIKPSPVVQEHRPRDHGDEIA